MMLSIKEIFFVMIAFSNVNEKVRVMCSREDIQRDNYYHREYLCVISDLFV